MTSTPTCILSSPMDNVDFHVIPRTESKVLHWYNRQKRRILFLYGLTKLAILSIISLVLIAGLSISLISKPASEIEDNFNTQIKNKWQMRTGKTTQAMTPLMNYIMTQATRDPMAGWKDYLRPQLQKELGVSPEKK